MEYTGFVSYSGSAGPIAGRLHKALERYVIPKPLRGLKTSAGTIGKSAGKFFVDRAELSATPHLKADIEAALDASRHLIVLCSPEAAQSVWVPLEIAYFKRIGRGDRIIPVLVDGTPEVFDPETAPTGAFPQELVSDAQDLPLAPDFREEDARGEGFDTAMLRVMARVLGLEFPELTQRHLVAEREKQRARNRVIVALSVLLVLAVAGGWTAWTQKQAADQRLAQALGSAARQVELASGFRDRYGIPSSVSAELYGSAASDFENIVADAGENPNLILERARYSLGMAQLSADLEGSATQDSGYLSQAQVDLEHAKRLRELWYARLWFGNLPSENAILRQQITALQREARQAARFGQGEQAEVLGKRAQTFAQELAGFTGEQETSDTVYSQCALASVLYELSQVSNAFALRETCLAGARRLWAKDETPAHETLVVRALIDTATLMRLQRDRQKDALVLFEEAVDMARSGLKGSNDARILATEALVGYADTRNIMDVPEVQKTTELTAQLALYREVDDILSDLVASDANRRDWKVLRATNTYRMAGILGRMAQSSEAARQAEMLNEGASRLSESIETVANLVARAPDDLSLHRMLSALLESRAEMHVMMLGEDGGAKRDALGPGIHADLALLMKIRVVMAETHEDYGFYQRDLANAYLTKARLLAKMGGGPAEIAPDFEAARDIFRSLSEKEGFSDWSARDLALTDYHQAQLYAAHDQAAQACPFAKRAAAFLAAQQDAYPDDLRIANEASETQALVREVCKE